MTQSINPQRIEFEEKNITPVLTGLLIFLLIFIFSLENGALGGGMKIDRWLPVNVYTLSHFSGLLEKKDYAGLLSCMFYTNFASFHILQMSFNCYFFWVFGKHVEQKLGPLLYLALICFGISIPILVLNWDMSMAHELSKGFVGPFFVLTGILGTYMVFPPIPKSKMRTMGMPQQQKGQIFKRGGRPDPLDKYIANPWMFVMTFSVIQALFHFWLKYGFWIFEKNPDYDNMAIYPALSSIAFGYVIATYLQGRATASMKEGPMTLQALKTYHNLIDLDVGHEDALRGTARTLGLPYDKVKQWVAKNKGNLRVK